ncbi:MAG: T9SS type A sorting domain-containing protein [Bacteroidia bacterium]|nr:T9SS type A sorting domain-containing protein [Bacteroidia bacterium]
MKKFYLFAFVFASCMAYGQAPLATDDFNYTAGDALTAHGWAVHSGTSNPIVTTSPGLTFTGYVGSGIGLAAGVNNTGYDLHKLFAQQTTPEDIYTSFMVNATANTGAGGYFFHLYDSTAVTAFRARTYITPSTGKMQIGLSFNASAQQASSTTLLDFGVTYLFVVKYSIVDGLINDKVSLYVFEAGDDFSTEPATPFIGPLTGTLTTDAIPVIGPDIIPNGIAIRQFEAAQRITVDGFRVKTKWELGVDAALTKPSSEVLGFYPNPVTNGYINLMQPTNATKHIEVLDLLGKKVFNDTSVSNKVNVSQLNSGIYFLKVTCGQSVSSSRLIVK